MQRSGTELGRHLLTARGLQWLQGTDGDPYALLLRSENPDANEWYRQVRAKGTIYHSEVGAWVTASHSAATAILADSTMDWRHPGAADVQEHEISFEDPRMCHVLTLEEACLNLDRATYLRLREHSAFGTSPTNARRYRARFEHIVAEVLDSLPGEFDLLADFARPVALKAAGELLGLSATGSRRLAELGPSLEIALDATLCAQRYQSTVQLLTAIDELRDLVTSAIESTAGGDNLLSGMLNAGSTSHDALAVGVLTVVAGAAATSGLICNAVSALLDHRDQWDLVCAAPGRANVAVEETLRLAPPVKIERRITTSEVDIDGHRIDANQQIVVLVEAANQDPAVYCSPTRFQLTRQSGTPHHALTGGGYLELLGPLTRLQAAAALAGMAEAMPGLRRTAEVFHRVRSPVLRGVLQLPVAVN